MAENVYKKIIVVDENNDNPRAVSYPEAKQHGWIRRVSRVFLMDESRKILIQKRSKHISRPLLLDTSAAGHVDEGEEYEETAIRELFEELGVKAEQHDLIELPTTKEQGFFSKNFILQVESTISITIEPQEVDSYSWLTIEEIDTLVEQEFEKCMLSLVEVWPQVRDRIKSI